MAIICPHCSSSAITKKGYFRQKFSRKYIQRYWCHTCHRKFSASTLSITYRQKLPFVNLMVFKLLCSGVSLNRTAKNLGVNRKTVYSRFHWLSNLAEKHFREFQNQLRFCEILYFDEMESIEHTKLKPVTIPLLVNENQQILGVDCGELPAKGKLAEISRKKYGPRVSQSSTKLSEIFKELPISFWPHEVRSDGKPTYQTLVQERWPGIKHQVFTRKPVKRIEQPFLQSEKRVYDPMFALNQRCAKLRADINRLIRRSWSTTKKVDNLRRHLVLYACYNNGLQIL